MNFIESIKHVDKPDVIKTYRKANGAGILKYFGIGFGVGWILLFGLDLIQQNAPRLNYSQGYDLVGNALMYVVTMLTLLIPAIFGSIINAKEQCPTYGFVNVAGFLFTASVFILINPFIGLYTIFSCIVMILANIVKPGDYTLKLWHLVYYILLGAAVAAVNSQITLYYMDVWTYLQFVFLHLVVVIAISTKIRQWCYCYIVGWAIYSIIDMIAIDLLVGFYNLITPSILTVVALIFFFKIWRPMASKMRSVQ